MRIYNKNYTINTSENKKIVHISDIHYCDDYKLKRLDKVLNNIKKINPDYICITGDLIDSSDIENINIDIYINWLNKLSNIAKLIIVFGNHDVEKIINKKRQYFINEYFIKKISNLNNCVLLRNSLYRDENITFLGFEPDYEFYENDNVDIINELNSFLMLDKNMFNILLIHDPSIILENKNKLNLEKINLILCGHTHGGLMPEFIKGHRGLISPKKMLLKKDMRGKYTIGNTTLIISSGIVKLSKRSHLTKLNDIYSSNIITITLKNEVIKSKNIY